MAMLDLSALGVGSPFGGLLSLPASQGFPGAEVPADDSAAAQEARDAAAAILARKIKGQRNGPFAAPDETAPAVQFALGNMAPTPAPVDTRPLNPIEEKMMAGVGGGPPVPQPITVPQATFGSLAPTAPFPAGTDPMTVGGSPSPAAIIPLPRPRPAEAPAVISSVDDTTLPANSQPTEGKRAPSDEGTPAVPGSSLFGRLQKGVSDNSNLLLGLAAGFAGAPSLGTGMSRGFAGAAAGGQLDTRAQQIALQQGTGRATYEALIAAGAPKQQALIAAFNPESTAAKALVQSYITDRKNEIKTVKSKDAFGNETERMYAVNPYDLTSKEISPTGAAAATGGTAPQAAGGTNAVFAAGVTPTTFDHSKVGDEYLGQFSPEVQSGVKAYLRGDSLPTGRQQQAQVIKQIAQKYGDDIGVPANDQAYYQKKNFVTSLGNTNSGVGMQVKGFQQGLEHMTELAAKLEKMGNVNGLGIAPLAHGVNAVRGMSTAQGDIRKGVDASAQALAGEIGKLYSGSSGGGVHERQATKDLFGKDLSGPELAGALESTLELMRGGLRTIEQRRDDLFGVDAKNIKGGNFLGHEQEKAIEKIQGVINRLRSGEAAPEAATSSQPLKPGNYVYDPKTKTFGSAR